MNVDSIRSFAMKKRDQLIIPFFVIAILFLLLNIIFFFIKLNSTLSDSSWGDIASIHQYWYNFANGRPFQLSIVGEVQGHGSAYNPYAYTIVMAGSVVITPMLFTAIYFLNQNVNTLYLIVILLNYLGMSIMIWKIMQYKCKYEYRYRLMLALSFLFITGGLFQVISCKCHPILFLGPFFLALYYFFIRQRFVPYLITTVLICLITEDSAVFLVGWAIYLALFEERKIDTKYKYSLLTFIIASVYLLLVTFIISPTATYHLIPTSDYAYTSHLLEGVYRMLSGLSISRFSVINPTNNLLLSALLPLTEFMPSIGIMMALPISYLIFNRRLKVEWKKICGLIFIAPITHIVISYVIAGGHHIQPFLLCILLALVLLLCSDTIDDKSADRKESSKVQGKKYYYLIFAFMFLVYFAVCVFNFIAGYGDSALYKLVYTSYMFILFVCILFPLVLSLSYDLKLRKVSLLPGKRHYLTIILLLLVVMSNGCLVGASIYTGMKLTFDDANTELIKSNRATIKYINELPSNGSVVYWTNRNVEAFITARSDLWRFPRYFDKADYLAVQKNVNDSFFEIPQQEDIPVLEAIDKGVSGSTGDIRSITDEDIKKITHYLVFENKSHRVVRDDENIIAFEKMHKETFEMPYFTVGFGWVRDVPKVLERYNIYLLLLHITI